MSQPSPPQLGEVVFDQSHGEIRCHAVVRSAEDWEHRADVILSSPAGQLWTSAQRPQEEYAFGVWAEGSGLPCLFTDVDGDGHTELLAPLPKSDLSPTVFRLFRWYPDTRELTLLRQASLLRDPHGVFRWEEFDPDDPGQVVWVDLFENGQALIVHRRKATVSHRYAGYQWSAQGLQEVAS